MRYASMLIVAVFLLAGTGCAAHRKSCCNNGCNSGCGGAGAACCHCGGCGQDGYGQPCGHCGGCGHCGCHGGGAGCDGCCDIRAGLFHHNNNPDCKRGGIYECFFCRHRRGGGGGGPGGPGGGGINGPVPAPSDPSAAAVSYPYYTNRAPRDFLMANPPSIGP